MLIWEYLGIIISALVMLIHRLPHPSKLKTIRQPYLGLWDIFLKVGEWFWFIQLVYTMAMGQYFMLCWGGWTSISSWLFWYEQKRTKVSHRNIPKCPDTGWWIWGSHSQCFCFSQMVPSVSIGKWIKADKSPLHQSNFVELLGMCGSNLAWLDAKTSV